MEKLADFLLHADGPEFDAHAIPSLTADEERELLEQLGVNVQPDPAEPVLDLIISRMKNVREFSLATGEAAKEAENDEEFADYGTVIIKTKSGKSTQGTLRVKKNDDRFGSIIFRGHDVEPNDLPTDAYSTMRVIETSETENYKPLWASAGSASDASNQSTEVCHTFLPTTALFIHIENVYGQNY